MNNELNRYSKEAIIEAIANVLDESKIKKLKTFLIQSQQETLKKNIEALRATIAEKTEVLHDLANKKSELVNDLFVKYGGNQEMLNLLLSSKSIEEFSKYNEVVQQMKKINRAITTCRRKIDQLHNEENEKKTDF